MRLRVFLVALVATAAADWLPRFLPLAARRQAGVLILVAHLAIAAVAAYRLTRGGHPVAAAVLSWVAVVLPVFLGSLVFVASGRAVASGLAPGMMVANLLLAAIVGLLGVLAGLVAAHVALRRLGRPATTAAV